MAFSLHKLFCLKCC